MKRSLNNLKILINNKKIYKTELFGKIMKLNYMAIIIESRIILQNTHAGILSGLERIIEDPKKLERLFLDLSQIKEFPFDEAPKDVRGNHPNQVRYVNVKSVRNGEIRYNVVDEVQFPVLTRSPPIVVRTRDYTSEQLEEIRYLYN